MARVTEKVIGLLHRLATGSRKTRNLFTPVGALIFAGFIGLVIYLSRLIDGLWSLPALPPNPYHLILALPFLAAGAFLSGWAMLHFAKAKGTPVPANPPPKLVTSGPYALSRNPMLGGIFLMMFGLGLLLQSSSMICLFAPLFAGLNYWELKAIEEPELIKRLGRDYLAYRERTPMFLPGWGKRRISRIL